ncbi:MFS transporter [Megasphaera cerevisiae DSM 20462]|uniref:MFS transporter n=1 Tax=Megasphaera cerevisiae DSM 20462 TaxID=1122219 RepID=A0A0J6WUU5_9FIRM|nr:MFS transporter [Megasphaera cerevisiae]KMO85532.1 MFS transporter [Megasphaera cerevisiae DSM 20462]OKY52909.1 MFS transporter [Megasphaera cerevisiae]SJZ74556.1 Sugar phosphate permease [Megasphaera cerevisiae DSM 20462]
MRGFSRNGSTNKYWTLFMLYMGFCIAYVDRTAINISLSAIGQEFQLTPATLGIVLSSFFVGYTIMQLPGGYLADKIGSKKVIMMALTFWSVFTLATGFTYSLAALLIVRFLFGLGEGSFPPASFKGISEYFPHDERAKMAGVLVSSNYVGSAIAPVLVVPLMLFLGWRGMFHVLGILGFAYVFFYWLKVEQIHVVHKPLEVSLKQDEKKKIDVKSVITLPLMWQLLIAWFALSLINKGLDSWMPTYLLTVRHLDLKAVGILTPLPFVAAGISTAVSGYVMDHFFDKKEKYLLSGCAVLTAVFLYFMYTSVSVFSVIAFQCLVYFFKSFVLGCVLALPLKLLPQAVSGSAVGMINLGGQAAGFISPALIGCIITVFHGSYDAVFIFLIIAACCSACASLTIGKRRTDRLL